MNAEKTYTLDDIYGILANLGNERSESFEKMRRIKLPIPDEYGGGWATGSTQEEAVRKLIERIKGQIGNDKIGPYFSEYARKWFEIKKGEERSPSTIANYEWLLDTQIIPFFDGMRLKEVKPDDIQLYFNSIMKLSKSVSVQSRAILSGIFERAERNELIEKNPMRFKYEWSKKVGQKVVLQDEDLLDVIRDLEKLLGTKDIRDYLYACFLCFTALRRGEILGLRWKDIDFENAEIRVRNNVSFPNGINEPHVGSPKDGSDGIVHLNSELAERIKNYAGKDDEYVVPFGDKSKTEPITRSMFTKMWKRISNVLDLKGATSHSFRATYATMMNAHCTRVDPKALQGALRHKTPDLAIKVYTKSNENKTRQAEIEYDAYLCRALEHDKERLVKAAIR